MENRILVPFWKQVEGLLLFSWTWSKIKSTFFDDRSRQGPRTLLENKSCSEMLPVVASFQTRFISLSTLMFSMCWSKWNPICERESEKEGEGDRLNSNERFERSGNTVPIWMPSFIVRKDETNLCRFNFEAHWRKKEEERAGGSGARVRVKYCHSSS